jgi:hypothetical protein
VRKAGAGMTAFRVTAIEPDEDSPMPAIDAYMALAEAMHDEDDTCNANYVIPFAECATREFDIQAAVRVLVALRKDDWSLVRDPAHATRLGL